MNSKTLGIIPARSKSKSIKNKNLIDLGGKPLIAWTIEESLNSNIDKIIVSTNSKKIAKVAEDYGAEVPFIRPQYLASDIAHTGEVIKHASEMMGDEYDTVITLQPTTPFRKKKHINISLNRFNKSNYDSFITLCKVGFPPEWYIDLYFCGKGELWFPYWDRTVSPFQMERQELPTYYKPNGAIYITDRNYLFKTADIVNVRSCGYYIMDDKSSVDIDTWRDYMIAKEMIK